MGHGFESHCDHKIVYYIAFFHVLHIVLGYAFIYNKLSIWVYSTAVVQLTINQQVIGSNPIIPAIHIININILSLIFTMGFQWLRC